MAKQVQTSSVRDKYKATSITQLKESIQEEDSKLGQRGGGQDYLSFTDGTNKFRIYPKKEDDKNFYVMKNVHWLPLEGDGGIKRKPVLDATIHGGLSKDPVEEYIKLVQKQLDKSDPESQKKLNTMLGNGMDNKNSIKGSISWMAYAAKISKDTRQFGLFEMKRSVRDQMNSMSTIEDESEPIELDPFTDPDTGRCVMIVYNSKSKTPAGYYKSTISQNPTPLTDEELDAFDKIPSLTSLYVNVFDEAMLDKCIQGISNFDSEFEIGVFETEEFEAIIQEIRDEMESGTVVKTVPTKKVSNLKKFEEHVEEETEEVEEEIEEEQTGDILTTLDRNGLLKFIKENSLDIKLVKSKSDDDYRTEIRSMVSFEENEEEIEAEEEIEEVVVKPQPKVQSTKPAAKNAKVEQQKPTMNKPKTLEEIKAEIRAKAGK